MDGTLNFKFKKKKERKIRNGTAIAAAVAITVAVAVSNITEPTHVNSSVLYFRKVRAARRRCRRGTSGVTNEPQLCTLN